MKDPDIKINHPLLLRATRFLYQKAHTYNSNHVSDPEDRLFWTNRHLMSAVELFHSMLIQIYLAWRHFVRFLQNDPIFPEFRDLLYRVFRQLKAVGKRVSS